MVFYIKNMVCDRCVMVVKQQFEELGLPIKRIQLGEVEATTAPDVNVVEDLKERIRNLGFELMDDKKARIVEQIKAAIIQVIHNNGEFQLNKKLSVFLSEKLGADYHYLTSLFTSIEGITIEKYVILQRIEKAKELLLYNELTLNQIADKLGYSSVQHLSSQFKNVTGLTPSHFKQVKEMKRKPLDKVGKVEE
jgi:AraC-like DNA-binding protein